MGTYDAVCIFSPLTAEDKIDALLNKFEKRIKDQAGEVLKVEKWGIRKLPFTLSRHKKLKEGYYVLIVFSGSGATVTALRDIFRVQEEIVRHLITQAGKVEAPAVEPAFPEAQLIEPAPAEEHGQP